MATHLASFPGCTHGLGTRLPLPQNLHVSVNPVYMCIVGSLTFHLELSCTVAGLIDILEVPS